MKVDDSHMSEYIIDILSKFFEVGFYQKQYYDIVITNKKLILVWLGESFKPWMLRADPGQNKRDNLSSLDIDNIIRYSKNNIIIDYSHIKDINLNKRNLFKNAYIAVTTRDEEYKLYTEDKKIDMNKVFHTLNKILKAKVSLK